MINIDNSILKKLSTSSRRETIYDVIHALEPDFVVLNVKRLTTEIKNKQREHKQKIDRAVYIVRRRLLIREISKTIPMEIVDSILYTHRGKVTAV